MQCGVSQCDISDVVMWVTHAVWLVYGQNESLEGIPARTGMRLCGDTGLPFQFLSIFSVLVRRVVTTPTKKSDFLGSLRGLE